MGRIESAAVAALNGYGRQIERLGTLRESETDSILLLWFLSYMATESDSSLRYCDNAGMFVPDSDVMEIIDRIYDRVNDCLSDMSCLIWPDICECAGETHPQWHINMAVRVGDCRMVSDGPAYLVTNDDENIFIELDFCAGSYDYIADYGSGNNCNCNGFSGDYNDLINRPQIPVQVNSDWNATSGVAEILNKPDIPTLRTMNHERLTDSTLGDIDIHDGFYFPNAVQDYDGNWYGAVVVGDQVWLAENLRTKHYTDGTAIEFGVNRVSEATAYYYDYSDLGIPLEERGYLYNWPAVMNGSSSSEDNPSRVQGIAPEGWHIPSESEFRQLTDYLSRQDRFTFGGKENNAKSVATDKNYWNTSSVLYTPGNDISTNNASGLNIVPGGSYDNGNYGYIGYAYFWTTNENGGMKAINTGIASEITSFRYGDANAFKWKGFSVRCVSNLNPVQFRNWYVSEYGSMQHHLPEELDVPVIIFKYW